jgi:hypothetical protein
LNWKTKAAVQRFFARLPLGFEPVYYQLQRVAGNLRRPESPIPMFEHAAEIFSKLARLGTPVEGARVLEVGTGHRINMPIAFYLAGAGNIISIDLFPILKRPLVMQMVADLALRAEDVKAIFAAYGAGAVGERLARISAARSFDELAERMRLEYRAPCDATRTGLPAKSVDIHFSYTVFEHIPREVLAAILREGSRLVADRGLLCHHIDLSDHFSHADGSIGKINFLQYSGAEWARIDNPRYGYQNRLRVTDYRAIYEEARQELKAWLVKVDPEAVETIRIGFPLAAEYRGIDPEALATVGVTAISRLRNHSGG